MKIQLKRSNVLESGAAKAPTAAQMEYGEIAVNYNTADPTLFIKDSANGIVRIGDDSAELKQLQDDLNNLNSDLQDLTKDVETIDTNLQNLTDQYNETVKLIPNPLTGTSHQDDTLDERYISRFSWADLPEFSTAP